MVFPLAVVSGLSSAGEALSEVLLKEQASELCQQTTAGLQVAPRQLIKVVLNAAQVLPYLDGANANGLEDDNISPTEQIYAILNADQQPFGPRRDYGRADVDSAKRRLLRALRPVIEVVRLGRSRDGYYIRNPNVGSAEDTDYTGLFSDPARLAIACGAPPPAVARAQPRMLPAEIISIFKLRGRIDELAARVEKPDDLLRLDPADVSFRRDEEVDVNTISIDGVAGFEIRAGFGAWRTLPFVAYQRTEVDDPEAEDVNVLTPGIFLDRRGLYAGDFLRLDTSFEGSAPLDLEQESRRARARANVGPTIRTPCGFLFGEELSCTGPLILRPELALLTETAWVFASGDSAELADADSYLGFGADLSLTVRLPVVRELYGLALKAGLRDLRLVAGDTDIDDVRRWRASLTFSPPDVPNVALELAYENGDNQESFQNEEFYKLALARISHG